VTSHESRQNAVLLAVALFAGCALVTLVTGTLMGAYGARLGGMRTLVIVAISSLTAVVVRGIWMRRHLPSPPVPAGAAGKAAAFKGMVVNLVGYLVLMAAVGAFFGYHQPALGVSRPVTTGLTTVLTSLIFVPFLTKRVDVWKRSRG